MQSIWLRPHVRLGFWLIIIDLVVVSAVRCASIQSRRIRVAASAAIGIAASIWAWQFCIYSM